MEKWAVTYFEGMKNSEKKKIETKVNF